MKTINNVPYVKEMKNPNWQVQTAWVTSVNTMSGAFQVQGQKSFEVLCISMWFINNICSLKFSCHVIKSDILNNLLDCISVTIDVYNYENTKHDKIFHETDNQ